MSLKLYNSLSRKIENFQPLQPPNVGVYICGPTVYDYTHIGHMRTYINSDVLLRVLKANHFQVKSVMNITDVGHLTGDRDMGEDKMEKAAQAKKKTIWQIAKFYTDYFWKTMKAINVQKADVICSATGHIQEMINLIKKIEKNGYVYQTKDGLYFDTSKLKDYGKLAHLDIGGLKEGARVEKNLEKKNPTDFALWKFSFPAMKRQMEWDSPWGKGFPGWHIECSAMSQKYLGETFDIHTGGVDHIPVHHTNEIAQSEAASGKLIARYWFHSEYLLIDDRKMSKSLNNFYTLDDIEKNKFKPLSLRYLFLTAHYRSKLNFTWHILRGAEQALSRLRRLLNNLSASNGLEKTDMEQLKADFQKAINNDLNMPQALAVVWRLAKSSLLLKEKRKFVKDWDQVLGLDLIKKQAVLKVPVEIKSLFIRREELRRQKKYQQADRIRKKIEAKGFIIEDFNSGSKIIKK